MSTDLYARVVDSMTYAIHGAAMRRDASKVPGLIATRDEFAALYPEHRDAYVPAGER